MDVQFTKQLRERLVAFGLLLLFVLFATGSGVVPGLAAGPVETSIFAVQGVDVDVTDSDAATAKQKALVEVQVKAFRQLAEKLGNAELAAAVAEMPEGEVLPYLRSLSIEQEAISPGRYTGKFTVRFLPAKVKALYQGHGVDVASEQGPSFLILPVWMGPGGPVLWEDNPWRQAWINLRAEQSVIPVIVPLGDLDDSEMVSATDVMNNDPVKLEAIRRRYDVKTVVLAFAEPGENGTIHAKMSGDSPLGKLAFDKTYDAETGNAADSAKLAAERFHAVMIEKYKSGVAKAEAEREADANKPKRISVTVPFSGPSQWNGLRSRILATPGVVGLDVASLGIDGAVVTLSFSGTTSSLASSLQASGLQMSEVAGGWVIVTN